MTPILARYGGVRLRIRRRAGARRSEPGIHPGVRHRVSRIAAAARGSFADPALRRGLRGGGSSRSVGAFDGAGKVTNEQPGIFTQELESAFKSHGLVRRSYNWLPKCPRMPMLGFRRS